MATIKHFSYHVRITRIWFYDIFRMSAQFGSFIYIVAPADLGSTRQGLRSVANSIKTILRWPEIVLPSFCLFISTSYCILTSVFVHSCGELDQGTDWVEN